MYILRGPGNPVSNFGSVKKRTLLGSTEVICVHSVRIMIKPKFPAMNSLKKYIEYSLSRVCHFPMCKHKYICYININKNKYQRNAKHRTQHEHYHTVGQRKLYSHTTYVQLFPVTSIIQMKFITLSTSQNRYEIPKKLYCYTFLLQVLL